MGLFRIPTKRGPDSVGAAVCAAHPLNRLGCEWLMRLQVGRLIRSIQLLLLGLVGRCCCGLSCACFDTDFGNLALTDVVA